MNKVLPLLRKIPEGKVTTYKELAEAADSHPRAVGKILNSNPEPDKYPCYKVVKSDGKLGGYKLGKDKKAELLGEDGAQVKGGKVDLGKCLFEFSEGNDF